MSHWVDWTTCPACLDHRHFACYDRWSNERACDCDTCDQIREDALQNRLVKEKEDV